VPLCLSGYNNTAEGRLILYNKCRPLDQKITFFYDGGLHPKGNHSSQHFVLKILYKLLAGSKAAATLKLFKSLMLLKIKAKKIRETLVTHYNLNSLFSSLSAYTSEGNLFSV
jgi:hypothetical protein